MMSATGFIQDSEMGVFDRFFRFVRLPHFSEYFMSVDHHQIWRRHLAWSLRDGDHLRNAVTSRFASNMVFMSLLLGTEIGVLFSPSKPADRFRAALRDEKYSDPNFWAAIILCISIGLTLSTLVANFTAWAIIGAVSPHNSHAILRSSMGLAAAQLPARLVIISIYCFVAWVMAFIGILVPNVWGYFIALFPVVLIGYIVIFYSSVGRLVIYSRAMQHKEIFKEEEEFKMAPRRLFEELLKKAEKEKVKKSPLPLVYRSKRELSEKLSELRLKEQDEMEDMGFGSSHATHYVNRILDSSGHHDVPLPILQDMLKSYDEEDIENGNGDCPQNPADTDRPQEDGDVMGPLKPMRQLSGSSRTGMRRGQSDSGVIYGDKQSHKSSTKAMFENSSPGAQMTITL